MPSVAAKRLLKDLQVAGYGALGYPPPLFDLEELRQRSAHNQVQLADGGPLDLELQQKGLPPEVRRRLLEDSRRADAQVDEHRDTERVLALYATAPSPHVDPFHHSILLNLQTAIESLPDALPGFPYAQGIRSLNGKVTLSTAPSGQVNAKTFPVPGTDEYVIIFDPAFFSFIYSMSIGLAQVLDGDAAEAACRRYATTGVEEDLRAALQKEDRGYSDFFFRTLASFFRSGIGPRPAAYDEQSFQLADHLRETAALFIAGHEYAHILRGHFGAHPGAAESEHPREQEFEADWVSCDILNGACILARKPPRVRFMGAHFVFISAAIIDAARQTLISGKACPLDDILAASALPDGSGTHPMALLRLAQTNQWIAKNLSGGAGRGAEFYTALLLKAATLLWKTVTPGVLEMHEKGVRPPLDWMGLDIFEGSK